MATPILRGARRSTTIHEMPAQSEQIYFAGLPLSRSHRRPIGLSGRLTPFFDLYQE
jgi:hypothetical protein